MVQPKTAIQLRGAVQLDQLQPQVAATIAANSDGFFPVAGESAFWVEVSPGMVVNRLMDVALKTCDVTPGALITERHYGTMEVHGPDQGQVFQACDAIMSEIGCQIEDQMRPTVLIDEVIRKLTSHHASLINRTRAGMLVLADDTLYTLEVTPAVHVLAAANVAEKTSSIRIVGLGSDGAVGRLRLAGTDAEIDMAVEAVRRVISEIPGKLAPGVL
ncbi:MAG: ethanolamine utilization microcompartment shell protein EutS [Planctomycetota bacterium]|jgi:ethanolamine utilization microcompartment shell protein EutS